MAWVVLGIAIASEIVATLALRSMAGGIRLWSVVLVVAGYLTSFTLLALALKSLNVGVVYAVWSGVGIAGVAIAASFLFAEKLNLTAIAGIAIITVGVAVVASSGASGHA